MMKPSNEAFIVQVLELPGCFANGATYLEAVTNAQRIIQNTDQNCPRIRPPHPQPQGPPRACLDDLPRLKSLPKELGRSNTTSLDFSNDQSPCDGCYSASELHPGASLHQPRSSHLRLFSSPQFRYFSRTPRPRLFLSGDRHEWDDRLAK